MGFFDLNIPYYESDKQITNKFARKTTRLKQIVKAMELGYTGVAYNRTIKGVMADSDRCSIPLFPLPSLLNLAPSLSSAVELHRKLLDVPVSTPFRQYTRLTVVVDNSAQASAVNSRNHILKSYDILAVKPVNQIAFEQACRVSEVDLIAIDFSDKLPFRFKQPLVKAALERGIYFEITYSGLIMNAQVRRQLISNVKLLVDWTRGKNFIISSASPSVTELRGPYDVSNLSSLLGLSMERAKAALSKNCRSLIANALKRKHCYKGTIRVEPLTLDTQVVLKGPSFTDWLKWDPISSGEGDLLLDDIAKSFSVSGKGVKTMKAIDFSSVTCSFPSHGLQIKDFVTTTDLASKAPDICKTFPVVVETEVQVAVNEVSKQQEKLNWPTECQTSANGIPSEHQTPSFEDFENPYSPSKPKEIENHAISLEDPTKIPEDLDTYCDPNAIEMHPPQSSISDSDRYIVLGDDRATVATTNSIDIPENLFQSCDTNISAIQPEESKTSNEEGALGAYSFMMDVVSTQGNVKDADDVGLVSDKLSLREAHPEKEQFSIVKDDSAILSESLHATNAYHETNDNNYCSVACIGPLDDMRSGEQIQCADRTGMNHSILTKSATWKGSEKRKKSFQGSVFPLRRLLNPVPFKKKNRNFKNKH